MKVILSKHYVFFIWTLLLFQSAFISFGQTQERFQMEKDLLLVHMDCKTDVDDIHTAAALFTLISQPKYSNVNIFPVVGTYGEQEGLYVPPNELMKEAFGNQWADAHGNWDQALQEVFKKAKKTFQKGGDIWIAEAGQSNFSSDLAKKIQEELPQVDLSERMHIVQHSDWNEEVTKEESLAFVQSYTDYHKIPDGNVVGNGTPGFRTPGYTQWKTELTDPMVKKVWEVAVRIGLTYNGKDGRYNNEAVAENGLDFSDLSEVCYMLGLEDIKDTDEFFKRFSNN